MTYSVIINKQTMPDAITAQQAHALMDTLEKTSLSDGKCFDQVFVVIHRGTWHINNGERTPCKAAKLEIGTFINYHENSHSSWPKMGTHRCCCMPKGQTCAQQIAAGKCTDPFMRKVGAALWPQVYAKGR